MYILRVDIGCPLVCRSDEKHEEAIINPFPDMGYGDYAACTS